MSCVKFGYLHKVVRFFGGLPLKPKSRGQVNEHIFPLCFDATGSERPGSETGCGWRGTGPCSRIASTTTGALGRGWGPGPISFGCAFAKGGIIQHRWFPFGVSLKQSQTGWKATQVAFVFWTSPFWKGHSSEFPLVGRCWKWTEQETCQCLCKTWVQVSVCWLPKVHSE